MSDALPPAKFAELVRKGLLSADETYRDWTNGWGLADGGVEGFITTWIAKHLLDETRGQHGPQGGYAALELRLNELIFDLSFDDRREHFSQLLEKARKSDPEIADSLKQQARLDLVYYDGSWPDNADKLRPRGIVEVKRWFDKSTYPKDMRRIANLLNAFGPANGGSLLYGCFVFFIFEREGARAPLQSAIDKIKNSDEAFRGYGCDCLIEETMAPSSNGNPAKAASLSVTFTAKV